MKEGFAPHVVAGHSPKAVLENDSTIKKTKTLKSLPNKVKSRIKNLEFSRSY